MNEPDIDLKAVIKAVALITIGAILLLPGACGAYFFIDYLIYQFPDTLRFAMPVVHVFNDFIMLSLGSIFISTILLGLLMRSLRWRGASLMSLGLSFVAGLLATTGFLSMLLRILPARHIPGFQTELLKLVLVFIAVLLVVALPPFLHWRNHQRPRP